MKHLELHIIQSVPVACLNRDDLNSPKTAVFWRRPAGTGVEPILEAGDSRDGKGNFPSAIQGGEDPIDV